MLTRRTFATIATTLPLGAELRAAEFAIPQGACDCHVHIIGPQDRYPMVPNRVYTPPSASVDDLLALRARLGLSRTVLVQPSFYGPDNRCMLDALQHLANTARAVAVVRPDVSEADLLALDRQGVRGVRLNIETGGGRDTHEVTDALHALAPKLAPLRWHIQIYAALPVIAQIASTVATLPVPVVFDHFGAPDAALGPNQPGFPALLELLHAKKAYVKLSAPYRISRQAPDYADVAPIARALIEAGPDQLVWASDWPHTDRKPGASGTEISPFRVVDDLAIFRFLADWAPDPATRRAILTDTPARLYRFG